MLKFSHMPSFVSDTMGGLVSVLGFGSEESEKHTAKEASWELDEGKVSNQGCWALEMVAMVF